MARGELIATTVENMNLEEVLDSMTELQRRFVDEFLQTPIAANAYRRAGGTAQGESAICSIASELLINPKVARALKILREQRAMRVRVDSDWVLRKLLDTLEKCLEQQKVYNAQGEWNGTWCFDSKGATRCLELVMKHLGMFERDNRQKGNAQERGEAALARLKLLGLDFDKRRALPEVDTNGN